MRFLTLGLLLSSTLALAAAEPAKQKIIPDGAKLDSLALKYGDRSKIDSTYTFNHENRMTATWTRSPDPKKKTQYVNKELQLDANKGAGLLTAVTNLKLTPGECKERYQKDLLAVMYVDAAGKMGRTWVSKLGTACTKADFYATSADFEALVKQFKEQIPEPAPSEFKE